MEKVKENILRHKKALGIVLGILPPVVISLILGILLYQMRCVMYMVKASVSYPYILSVGGGLYIGLSISLMITFLIGGVETWAISRIFKLKINRRTFCYVIILEAIIGGGGGVMISNGIYLSQEFSASIVDAYLVSFRGPAAFTPAVIISLMGNYSVLGGIILMVYVALILPFGILHSRLPVSVLISLIEVFGGLALLDSTYFIPYFAVVNGATPVLAIIIMFFGIFILVSGILSLKSEYVASRVTCLLVIAGVMGGVLGTGYMLHWQANYREWEWPQVRESVYLAQWAVGVSLKEHNISETLWPEYPETLINVPQWWYNYTVGGADYPWEVPSDMDPIVMVSDGKPRLYYAETFSLSSNVSWDWKSRHLVYTHVESFYLIDPNIVYEGFPVVFNTSASAQLLNLTEPVVFYYSDDKSFRGPIFLDSPYTECGTVTYNWTPDYSLSGLESYVYNVFGFITGGDLSFAGKPTKVLILRDVRKRISAILPSWLKTDNDPYPVVLNGQLFLTSPVYMELPLPPMVPSNFYRMVGWILVSVRDGTFIFYKYWNMDPSIESVVDMYPWKNPPPQFMMQARFPYSLAKKILKVDETIHVHPPHYSMEDWISGDYFYVFANSLIDVSLKINNSWNWYLLGYSSYLADNSKLGAIYLVKNGPELGEIDVLSSNVSLLSWNAAEKKISLYTNNSLAESPPVFIPIEHEFYWGVSLFLHNEKVTIFDSYALVNMRTGKLFMGKDIALAYMATVSTMSSSSNESRIFMHTPYLVLSAGVNGSYRYIVENDANVSRNIEVELSCQYQWLRVFNNESEVPFVNSSGNFKWNVRNLSLSPGEIAGNVLTIEISPPETPVLVIIMLKITDTDREITLDTAITRIWVL